MEMKERFNKYILYISLGALLNSKVMNENKDLWKENILKFYELVKYDLPDTFNKNRIDLLGSLMD